MAAPTTRVLIADDHALVRQALRQLLVDEQLGIGSLQPRLCVTEAEAFDTAMQALAQEGADLLLIDLSMPGMAGAASLRALRTAHPATKIVVITGREERSTMLDCLAAGVHGFVPKSTATDQIVRAINTILSGGVYVPAEIANIGGNEATPENPAANSAPHASPPAKHFTQRQLDVLKLLGQGRTTKEIARTLALAEGTVKVHLAAVYRALNARNRAEAVALASKLAL